MQCKPDPSATLHNGSQPTRYHRPHSAKFVYLMTQSTTRYESFPKAQKDYNRQERDREEKVPQLTPKVLDGFIHCFLEPPVSNHFHPHGIKKKRRRKFLIFRIIQSPQL